MYINGPQIIHLPKFSYSDIYYQVRKLWRAHSVYVSRADATLTMQREKSL